MNDITITRVRNGYIVFAHKTAGFEPDQYVAPDVSSLRDLVEVLATRMEKAHRGEIPSSALEWEEE